MAQDKFMLQTKRRFRPFLIIFGLCGALAFVIGAMRYTQGSGFQQTLAMFFNPPEVRMWYWCPARPTKLEPQGVRVFNPTLKTDDLCHVSIESVPEEMAQREMQPLVKISSDRESKTLEADSAMEVFRVDGLVFRSYNLSQLLKH